MEICSLCEDVIFGDAKLCDHCDSLHCEECWDIINAASVGDAVLRSHDAIFRAE